MIREVMPQVPISWLSYAYRGRWLPVEGRVSLHCRVARYEDLGHDEEGAHHVGGGALLAPAAPGLHPHEEAHAERHRDQNAPLRRRLSRGAALDELHEQRLIMSLDCSLTWYTAPSMLDMDIISRWLPIAWSTLRRQDVLSELRTLELAARLVGKSMHLRPTNGDRQPGPC